MKYALILNSSIIVKKPFFSKDKIKLEYGSNRIVSYEKGFEALLDKNIYKFFDDVILIDANKDELTLKVPEEEIQDRLSKWSNPKTPPKKGVLSKFAKSVKSASLGAVTD